MMIRCLFLLFFLLPVCAQERFPLFSEDLSFYQGFEDSVDADLSAGKEKPVWKAGTPRFESGLRGRALFCGKGGAKLRYQRKDNLNFDRPGTIVFFYRPLNWETEKNLPRLFFWAIESGKGYIGLQGANDPKNICMCERGFHLMLLFGKRLPVKVYSTPPTGKKGCSGWHMLAFSWAGDQLFVKWDDQPSKVFANGMALQDSDFPENSFSVGSDSHWNYLLDDFMVYARRITDEELNQLYQANMKTGKAQK